MTEYRYYLEAHVINYPQGVILHWPVDIPAVGGGSQNGAENAASPLADLSCRCLVVAGGDSIAVSSSGININIVASLPADFSCKFLLTITAISGP